MQSTSHTIETTTSSRRRRFVIAGCVVAIVALVLFSWVSWWSQTRLARRLAAIREHGEPTSLAELDSYYPSLPEDEDVTALWLRAATLLKPSQGSVETRKLPFLGEATHPPTAGHAWAEQELARQFLADHEPAMQLLHEAAAKGGRAHFELGFTPLLLEITNLRVCSRALALETNLKIHVGDFHGAAESIRTTLMLTRAIEDEPFAVSQLIRMAIFGSDAHELKQALASVDFANGDLLVLQATLQELDFKRSLTRLLIGERAYGIEQFESMAQTAGFRMAWDLAFSVDQHAYLDIMEELIVASEAPWPLMLEETDNIAARATQSSSLRTELTKQVVHSVKATINSVARSETVRRLLIIAIALERYRHTEGHPAADLASLVPNYLAELPDDPSTAKPFTYQRTDDGYVLFSPTQRFPLPSDAESDAETGANPTLLFRWPAVDESTTAPLPQSDVRESP